MKLRLSLQTRLVLITGMAAMLAVIVALLLSEWVENRWAEWSLALVIAFVATAFLVRWWSAPMVSLLRALSGSVASFRDGDFSFGIVHATDDELGDLVASHNELATVLREERQNLFQRELLLDTVIQNTPVAMVLTEPRGHVVYGNLAARQLFNSGRRLEGLLFDEVMAELPQSLRDALDQGGDRLFTVSGETEDDTYHLARRGFRLNGRPHELYLFRRLTAELSRQEVASWKKVIRVISHEINNSLGPIASLAHSGQELLRRGDSERMQRVFATIEERARHLDRFIGGYASFAKLPTPRLEQVDWMPFLQHLRSHYDFALDGEALATPGRFDPAQLQQALINLLKNAHESGTDPADVTLTLRRASGGVRIDVADRGPGMSDAVLANALVPFYSTKRSGTGLGLALAREIVEAHGGRIGLSNRDGGGLAVSLFLPQA
ncbi:sensor histidine kinase [Chiayiivirga flava]|uniref:histidine kinase n=1 Tax=Chiayiivirga flava TaxID=659595 RepID=A0A7W8DA47_9GAMM|nr:ATP-binding protein [Chiayiivirga flava]MBB5209567.1 nitrogen fixation/metabolism regulation signal transduction histidine kinase [Chiayiivirga flava]